MKKRIVSAILAVLTLCSIMASTALAVEEESKGISTQEADVKGGEAASTQAHEHRFIQNGSVTTYSYLNTNTCSYAKYMTYKCSCGATDQSASPYETGTSQHREVVYSATCDGRYQSWKTRCGNCGTYLFTNTHLCYGGPHSGPCQWLPL